MTEIKIKCDICDNGIPREVDSRGFIMLNPKRNWRKEKESKSYSPYSPFGPFLNAKEGDIDLPDMCQKCYTAVFRTIVQKVKELKENK